MTDRRYVEVIGEAEYREAVESYVVELRLSVRTAARDARARSEIEALRQRVLQAMMGGGVIAQAEVEDRGEVMVPPWRPRGRGGEETAWMLVIRVSELQRLIYALSLVEALPRSVREGVTHRWRPPVLGDQSRARAEALVTAFGKARGMAGALAVAGGSQLGDLLELEELVVEVPPPEPPPRPAAPTAAVVPVPGTGLLLQQPPGAGTGPHLIPGQPPPAPGVGRSAPPEAHWGDSGGADNEDRLQMIRVACRARFELLVDEEVYE